MTNGQLFISAGLPSLLVLISMWRADKRMDAMDARMDRLETRLDSQNALTNSRIDRIADDLSRFYEILSR